MDHIWSLRVRIYKKYPFLEVVLANLRLFRTFLIEKIPKFVISDPKNQYWVKSGGGWKLDTLNRILTGVLGQK